MKKGFVEWLQARSAEEAQCATDYREAALGISKSKRALAIRELYDEEGTDWMLEEAKKYEEDAKRYESWRVLVEDMSRYGLEKEAIDFFYARKGVDEGRGRSAWNGYTIEWTTDGIAHHLEKQMVMSEQALELNKIYVTLCAMILPGMQPEFVDYYERKRRERPDLKLPAPEFLEEQS